MLAVSLFVAFFTCMMGSMTRRHFWFMGGATVPIVAIVLSLVDHTLHGYRPKNVVLVSSASGFWHARPSASRARALPGLVVYKFTHGIYYAN